VIKIISLELAKQLKEAGIEWEPKVGDMINYDVKLVWDKELEYDIYDIDGNVTHDISDIDENIFLSCEAIFNYIQYKNNKLDKSLFKETISFFESMIWLPNLDQLIKEIKKQRYFYTIIDEPDDKPYCEVWKSTKCNLDIVYYCETDDILEEAVGQTLLWILKNKGD
jgi:hypothetical protein